MLPRDLPPKNHPLLQNDDEVNTLADLVDVRDSRSQDTDQLPGALNDDDLDVSDALTFPHKPRAGRETTLDDVTDFDADARTSGPAGGDEETAYLTRADFEEEMLDADPDPNADSDEADYITGTNLGRAPDLSGTVMGAVRGLGTHLPQDLGADGFQIIEPEELAGELPDERLSAPTGHTFADARLGDDALDASASSAPDDGGRIPTAPSHPATRDEALDATRQLQ